MKLRFPAFHWDRFLRKARGRHGKIKRITNDSEQVQKLLYLIALVVIVFSVVAILYHDLFTSPGLVNIPRQFRN